MSQSAKQGKYACFTEADDNGKGAFILLNTRCGLSQVFLDDVAELDAESLSILAERDKWVCDQTEFDIDITVVGKFDKIWVATGIKYANNTAPLDSSTRSTADVLDNDTAYEDAAHANFLKHHG